MATSEQKGKNFLAESHTRKYMLKELYIPKLIDRGRRSTWKKKGSKDIIERARVKVDKVLADYQSYELPKDVEAQLLAMIKEIEARPLDRYMDVEGISGGTVNITGTEISLEKS